MSSDTSLGRLDRWGRSITPVLTVLFLVLLSVTPLPLPFQKAVAPSLPLMGVYCWVVMRPDLMPRIAVFCLGLLHDALIGLPIGVTALVYLSAHPVLEAQRRFLLRHSYFSLWWGYVLLVPSATILTWCLLSILNGTALPPVGLLSNLAGAILFFPFVAWVLSRCGSLLPAPAEHTYAPAR